MNRMDLMGIGRLLAWACSFWIAYQVVFNDYDIQARWFPSDSDNSTEQANASARFEQVVMPAGLPADAVWIFAQRNCPTPDRRRAETLAAELQRLGIPHVYEEEANFSGLDQKALESPEWQRTRQLIESGTYPVVMLDGVGKASPGLDEVIGEYRRYR